MRILLVNDDGIDAPGFRLLAKELGKSHTVVAVAPDGNRSAVGHGITLHSPLLVRKHELPGTAAAYGVSGTPGDCVRLGLDRLVEKPVNLVISGPNVGLNVGMDLHYSGTVSAALEGAMQGVKSIAVSAPPHADQRTVVSLFLRLLEQLDPGKDIRHALNINFPALPPEEIKGVKWVPQGLFYPWEDTYEQTDCSGQEYQYHVKGVEASVPSDCSTDVSAVINGYAAITPITFRFTDDEGLVEKHSFFQSNWLQ